MSKKSSSKSSNMKKSLASPSKVTTATKKEHKATKTSVDGSSKKNVAADKNQAVVKPQIRKRKSLYGRFRQGIDIFSSSAVENAYYICHNVQDCLLARGFKWPPENKGKKSRKSKKK